MLVNHGNDDSLSLTFKDYPSISQLAMKIAENKVNVIFAVVADQVGSLFCHLCYVTFVG